MKYLSILFLFLLVNLSVFSQENNLDNVLNSVVTVGVQKNDFSKKIMGFRGETIEDIAYKKALNMAGIISSGSGFIIKRNNKKYAVTNAHVVENASDEAGSIVVYSISRKKYKVKLVGGDSFYDIAVLEFIDEPGDDISFIDFKKNESKIGEQVYAVGNPLGEYPYTVSDGIVSAKNRVRGGMTGKFGFIQTTATVIWGNSGGPLVDTNGDVAGIMSQIAFATLPSGEQIWQSQINFALNAKLSERLIDDIINNNGRVKRAFIGLEISQKYGYNNYTESYYIVDSLPVISGVLPDAPSYKILEPLLGWEIVSVNNNEVRNVEEVLGEFENLTQNSKVNLKLFNGTEYKTININSGKLETKELESIGKFVLNSNEDIVPDYSSPYVSFKLKSSDNMYKKDKLQYKKYGSSVNEREYYIVAAGVAGEDRENMWAIETLRDFGAAMKLAGLAGVIDFYAIQKGDSPENVQLSRFYLSDNDDLLQLSLYY